MVSRSYVASLEENIRRFESADDGREPKRMRVADGPVEGSQGYSPVMNQNNCSTSPSTQSNSSPLSDERRRDDDANGGGGGGGTMGRLLVSVLSGGSVAPQVSEDLNNQIRQYSSAITGRGDYEEFIDHEKKSISSLGQEFLKQSRDLVTKNKASDITAYDYELVDRLARRYFTWMNSAHPVMHECRFFFLLRQYCAHPNNAALLDKFQVNMVIAISLASISRPHLSTSEIGRAAHDFFRVATDVSNQIIYGHGLQGLQNILLILQYTLLVPKAGNLWQLSGMAMRFATEMGLYTEPNPTETTDPITLDLRRRMFWTCYCIDRLLSTTMGRPTCIAESHISVNSPSVIGDRYITVNGILDGPSCQLKIAQIEQIRICRLQGEIHSRLYGSTSPENTPQDDLSSWSWHMYDQLRIWRNEFGLATPLITREWAELQFHIAVVLLFRPSPNRPNPSEEALHAAFHSSGEVMKLVKIMVRDFSAVFSWLTVQNLFMCGLTFVHSLKELVEKGTSKVCLTLAEIFHRTQACSATLETLSALEAGSTERMRNVFETASYTVLQGLSGVNQPFQRTNEHSNCIWAKIAASNDLSVKRPTTIENKIIQIQTSSPILKRWEDCIQTALNNHNEDHYREHDMHAIPQHISNCPSLTNPSPYIVKNIETWGPTQSSMDKLEPAPSGVPIPLENVSMERSTAAQPNSEPTRSSDLPDWNETELGAELERWFLYPFPEVTPSLSDLVNEQVGI
ncbi:hypothetical protein TRICI_004361 [Trichomonascus ciferrii]|uniref:Xylanolytic transcriptional activator regulatory domain-containing protein n=1 Tax=Trichomonascus ciferrii TaxID=44093 RepID=A0A642V7C9_9ASCO|nr:hypothetical protein TRICI_004361 [Trichomonascus ciferrii]